MTTGGGWQDQVGGALLGMRLTSAASADLGDPHEAKGMDALPDYEVRIARLPSAAAEFLSNRVACVFTGAVRLAATVARGVVDAWQRRAPGVEEALRACAAMGKDMADAFDRLGALPADAFVGEGGEDANAELEAVGPSWSGTRFCRSACGPRSTPRRSRRCTQRSRRTPPGRTYAARATGGTSWCS